MTGQPVKTCPQKKKKTSVVKAEMRRGAATPKIDAARGAGA